MVLKKFRPQQPDPYLSYKVPGDQEIARFGHLNTIVNYVNSFIVGPIGSIIQVTSDISLTDQNAIITNTNLSGTDSNAHYQINYYYNVKTIDAGAGQLRLNFNYTDSFGNFTLNTSTIRLNNTVAIRSSGVLTLTHIAPAGASIIYNTELTTGIIGSATYDLHIIVTKVVSPI